MSACVICKKDVSVHLYVRAKPLHDVDKKAHIFAGVRLREELLAVYRITYHNYLRRLAYTPHGLPMENHCRGHELPEVVEAIDSAFPSGNVRLLWNPGTRIRPLLRTQSPTDAPGLMRAINVVNPADIPTALDLLLEAHT